MSKVLNSQPTMLPSEFRVDWCFIREADAGEGAAFEDEIRREMARLYGGGNARGSWHLDVRREGGLRIGVVSAHGLTVLGTEDELLAEWESRMDSACWQWLGGYQLVVIPKEDAGCCALHLQKAAAHG